MAHRLLSLPLYQVPFTILDVETTGLTAGLGDAICEIALLQMLDGHEVDRFQKLVDPGRPLSPQAYEVNRISSELLRGAPTFGDIADDVLQRLEGTAIVAHNAPFDLSFLAAALEETRAPIPDNPVIDTLTLARYQYGFPRNSLGAIAHSLGIVIPRQHRAMSDVETTWRVFEFFLQDMQSRHHIGTLGELIQIQGGPIQWPRPVPRSGLPQVLVEALDQQRLLYLRYRSTAGKVSERIVEPRRVGTYRGSTYLVARCTLRGEQRTFRLDRILEMQLHEIA
ncbi:MAG: WYL domain-containing protein [Chloroflexia bacterium]|nr:WYL domain-containing protein [Chloroflexia bacterium]